MEKVLFRFHADWLEIYPSDQEVIQDHFQTLEGGIKYAKSVLQKPFMRTSKRKEQIDMFIGKWEAILACYAQSPKVEGNGTMEVNVVKKAPSIPWETLR